MRMIEFRARSTASVRALAGSATGLAATALTAAGFAETAIGAADAVARPRTTVSASVRGRVREPR